MRTVNIRQAKTHLSRLIKAAAAGEEIVIARAGKSVARLIPRQPAAVPRRPGALKGRVWIAPDFDAPLPPDLAQAFAADPVPLIAAEQ